MSRRARTAAGADALTTLGRERVGEALLDLAAIGEADDRRGAAARVDDHDGRGDGDLDAVRDEVVVGQLRERDRERRRRVRRSGRRAATSCATARASAVCGSTKAIATALCWRSAARDGAAAGPLRAGVARTACGGRRRGRRPLARARGRGGAGRGRVRRVVAPRARRRRSRSRRRRAPCRPRASGPRCPARRRWTARASSGRAQARRADSPPLDDFGRSATNHTAANSSVAASRICIGRETWDIPLVFGRKRSRALAAARARRARLDPQLAQLARVHRRRARR